MEEIFENCKWNVETTKGKTILKMWDFEKFTATDLCKPGV
jgi:hypothetical protein